MSLPDYGPKRGQQRAFPRCHWVRPQIVVHWVIRFLGRYSSEFQWHWMGLAIHIQMRKLREASSALMAPCGTRRKRKGENYYATTFFIQFLTAKFAWRGDRNGSFVVVLVIQFNNLTSNIFHEIIGKHSSLPMKLVETVMWPVHKIRGIYSVSTNLYLHEIWEFSEILYKKFNHHTCLIAITIIDYCINAISFLYCIP